jgi:hypothetical protein
VFCEPMDKVKMKYETLGSSGLIRMTVGDPAMHAIGALINMPVSNRHPRSRVHYNLVTEDFTDAMKFNNSFNHLKKCRDGCNDEWEPRQIERVRSSSHCGF